MSAARPEGAICADCARDEGLTRVDEFPSGHVHQGTENEPEIVIAERLRMPWEKERILCGQPFARQSIDQRGTKVEII